MTEDRRALLVALQALQYGLSVCNRLNSREFALSGAGVNMQAAIDTINKTLSNPDGET